MEPPAKPPRRRKDDHESREWLTREEIQAMQYREREHIEPRIRRLEDLQVETKNLLREGFARLEVAMSMSETDRQRQHGDNQEQHRKEQAATADLLKRIDNLEEQVKDVGTLKLGLEWIMKFAQIAQSIKWIAALTKSRTFWGAFALLLGAGAVSTPLEVLWFHLHPRPHPIQLQAPTPAPTNPQPTVPVQPTPLQPAPVVDLSKHPVSAKRHKRYHVTGR